MGIESPLVQISRDFDLQQLDGNQTQSYLSMWMNGAISQELLLQMLKEGEVLPSVDIDEEIEKVENEKDQAMGLLPEDYSPAQQNRDMADSVNDVEREQQRDEIREELP